MNEDKEISVFEVTVMIRQLDGMLRDFLCILRDSQASIASHKGHSNQG